MFGSFRTFQEDSERFRIIPEVPDRFRRVLDLFKSLEVRKLVKQKSPTICFVCQKTKSWELFAMDFMDISREMQFNVRGRLSLKFGVWPLATSTQRILLR